MPETDRSMFNLEMALRAGIFNGILKGLRSTREIARNYGLSEDDCSSILKGLESIEAIRHVGGRWEATEKGRKIFGDI